MRLSEEETMNRIFNDNPIMQLKDFEGAEFIQTDKKLIIKNNEDIIEIEIKRNKFDISYSKKYMNFNNIPTDIVGLLFADGKESFTKNIKLKYNKEGFSILGHFIAKLNSLPIEKIKLPKTIENGDFNIEVLKASNAIYEADQLGYANFIICNSIIKKKLDKHAGIEIVIDDSLDYVIVGRKNTMDDAGIICFQNYYNIIVEDIGFNPQNSYKILEFE